MSSMSPDLAYLVRVFLIQSPVILVYVMGIVVAIVFARRCPGVSALVAIAFGVMLITNVGFTFAQAYLNHLIREGNSYEQYRTWSTVLAVVSNFARAGSLAMLFAASFLGRSPKQ